MENTDNETQQSSLSAGSHNSQVCLRQKLSQPRSVLQNRTRYPKLLVLIAASGPMPASDRNPPIASLGPSGSRETIATSLIAKVRFNTSTAQYRSSLPADLIANWNTRTSVVGATFTFRYRPVADALVLFLEPGGGNRKPANPCAIPLESFVDRQLEHPNGNQQPLFSSLVCNKFPVNRIIRLPQTGFAGLSPPQFLKSNQLGVNEGLIAAKFEV